MTMPKVPVSESGYGGLVGLNLYCGSPPNFARTATEGLFVSEPRGSAGAVLSLQNLSRSARPMMKIDTGFLQWAAGVAFAAVCWLFSVHYALTRAKGDIKDQAKDMTDLRAHVESETCRLRAEIVAVDTRGTAKTTALQEAITRLELRIETGFASIIGKIEQLFKEHDKH